MPPRLGDAPRRMQDQMSHTRRMKPTMEPITMPAMAPPLRVSESSPEAVTVTVSARGRIRVGGKGVVDEGIAGMVALFSVSGPVLSWGCGE